MTAAHDVAGQRFSKLVVLGRAENLGSRSAWRCLCDCGREHVAATESLRNGKTKNCGCDPAKTGPAPKDIVGRVFEKLTVKSLAGASVRGPLWKCACVCGETLIVRATDLTTGHVTSCGCSRKFELELGSTSGLLTFLGEDSVRGKRIRYIRVRCACGKELAMQAASFIGGTSLSCGCLRYAAKRLQKAKRLEQQCDLNSSKGLPANGSGT